MTIPVSISTRSSMLTSRKIFSLITITLLAPGMALFDIRLDLTGLVGPVIINRPVLMNHPEHGDPLSRHKRYIYQEPDTDLVRKFERHLTAREGLDGGETCSFQDIVDAVVKECDALSHKALNESIHMFADHNYLVHYNHTERVYRYYRERYQDMAESLYHKMVFIVPHLVKKHMRSVIINITQDFQVLNYNCFAKFLDLDERVNTHFLSYGELFRSILVESYNDIEKNFYDIYTSKPQNIENFVPS